MPPDTDGFEPSANARAFAKVLFDTYMAMIKEGFTREDALEIIQGVIAANMKGSR